MKHKLLQSLMLIAALLTSTHAHAYHDFEVDGIYYSKYTNSLTCEVTFQGSSYRSYINEYTGSVSIPETVTYDGKTYSVISIDKDAFRGCYGLRSITIPNSVTSIGNDAFYDCDGLTSVNISDLEAWCNIDFGNNDANPLNYAKNLYLNGELLTGLVIPDSIKEIKNYAFYNCECLKSVIIGNSVTSIGNFAFSGCSSLISVNISDLEAWCKIDFGGSYANPLNYAKKLYLNGELLTGLVIPDSIEEIKNYAFYNCEGLKSITIPNSVTSIGSSAFYNCEGLKSITIPNSVTSIGSSAFSGCSGLTSVTIPNSVTSIGNYAFEYCSGLTSVNISDLEAWCKIDFGGSYANPLNYAKKLYLNGELLTGLVIPDSIKEIKNYAFFSCTSLTSVTIPNSVTSIGTSAFSGCRGLKGITIPNSVTSIGSCAFENCI